MQARSASLRRLDTSPLSYSSSAHGSRSKAIIRKGEYPLMMSETDTNIRVLDAAYKPFPPFNEWAAQINIDTIRWDRYYSSLQSRAKNLSPEVLDRARNVAKRAAALDTGAIEGLYEVDGGFTYTVACETAAWEAVPRTKRRASEVFIRGATARVRLRVGPCH
jgi:hypothetical protein